MNTDESSLETTLRQAPVPTPPPGLEVDLVQRMTQSSQSSDRQGAGAGSRASRGVVPTGREGWRRWWPALLPGLATVAFATGVVIQQAELNALRTELASLAAASPGPAEAPSTPPAAGPTAASAPGDRADLERLRLLVAALKEEVASAEAVAARNDALRAAIRDYSARLPEEIRGTAEFQERAYRIRCINNLKQLGLAVRVWATDNNDEFPPDILSMTNEMATPAVLVCPSDEGRTAATDWASYSPAHVSYEFLSPGPGRFEQEPLRLMWRCPIHGSITLCDGSAHMSVAREHPERIETRDGAQFLKPATPGVEAAATPPEPGASADSEPVPGTPETLDRARQGAAVLEARYGLAPGSVRMVVPFDPAVAARPGVSAVVTTHDGVATTNLLLPATGPDQP